jgi:uncharacterized protein (DUF1330 family)
MPAFYVAQVEWTDNAAREQYVAKVADTVKAFGGKLYAGSAEKLEGDWQPARLAIVEFDSMQRLRDWYDSAEYADLKKLRLDHSDSKAVVFTAA